VHEVKFNDAQYFLPKPTTALGQSTETVSRKSLNECSKYDASSEEEEGEIKFNFKPKCTKTRKLKDESDEEVIFHFKQVATSKVRTMPKGTNTSDFEEEVVFNFKPVNTPRIQITETDSGGDFEESDDSDIVTSEDENNDGRQLWEEESDEEIIYHILKKPYKGLETNNESEKSFMINIESGGGRDNSARPRLASEERLWRENFETHIWKTINEMRH
jgi:hypothetical protein